MIDKSSEKKPGRGGKRRGSGRKKPDVAADALITVRIPRAERDQYKEILDDRGETLSGYLRNCLKTLKPQK